MLGRHGQRSPSLADAHSLRRRRLAASRRMGCCEAGQAGQLVSTAATPPLVAPDGTGSLRDMDVIGPATAAVSLPDHIRGS